MRSSSARCLVSKAVACAEEPDDPDDPDRPGRENGKKLLGLEPVGALSVDAAGGGTAPVLGSGAGVGSGTFSAKADALPMKPNAKPQTNATTEVDALRPAISLSADTSVRRQRAKNTRIIRYVRGIANSRLPPRLRRQ